jgi:hypothetical protein
VVRVVEAGVQRVEVQRVAGLEVELERLVEGIAAEVTEDTTEDTTEVAVAVAGTTGAGTLEVGTMGVVGAMEADTTAQAQPSLASTRTCG